MRKGIALFCYLAIWAAVLAGTVYTVLRAGYSVWAGLATAYVLFTVLNGSLGYVVRRRQSIREGKVPPRYLQYLFFPRGIPKPGESADRGTHFLTSFMAAVAGTLLVICGIALAFDAEWSRISHPILVIVLCLVPGGIGAALLYGAWRIFIAGKMAPENGP